MPNKKKRNSQAGGGGDGGDSVILRVLREEEVSVTEVIGVLYTQETSMVLWSGAKSN